jgi:hypothetical protein
LETANFQVCCERSIEPAVHLARHAESLRGTLESKWLGETSAAEWRPRCQIVLYPTRQQYVADVGRGSERTVGSSLVSADRGKITRRRIDLLGGTTDYLSAALPHELTHVVLSDRFSSKPMPRWADEGTAILADPKAKQRRHFEDLRSALKQGDEFHAAALLSLDDYPRADRFGVFYGQSASLTEFLVRRQSPQMFIDFVDRANYDGIDKALRECYGFASVSDLHRQWSRQLEFGQPALSLGN